ncbi:hypothetical protein [Roseovarius nitratireducens]|uniref:hypothetical protein n=1 Tax=Roseovarius nitratireducens TaxID=2044597 RepID=UPI0013ED2196|nr:hypothetical protein [Roseovarius nitratireducens]
MALALGFRSGEVKADVDELRSELTLSADSGEKQRVAAAENGDLKSAQAPF